MPGLVTPFFSAEPVRDFAGAAGLRPRGLRPLLPGAARPRRLPARRRSSRPGSSRSPTTRRRSTAPPRRRRGIRGGARLRARVSQASSRARQVNQASRSSPSSSPPHAAAGCSSARRCLGLPMRRARGECASTRSRAGSRTSPTPMLVAAGLAGRGGVAWSAGRVCASRAFPRFGEPVSLRTFCSGSGRLAAERRTTISGERRSVEAVALWVHVDPSTLRPAQAGRGVPRRLRRERRRSRRVCLRLRHPEPRPRATRSATGASGPPTWTSPGTSTTRSTGSRSRSSTLRRRARGGDSRSSSASRGQPGDAEILRAGPAMWVEDPRGGVHGFDRFGLPLPRSG